MVYSEGSPISENTGLKGEISNKELNKSSSGNEKISALSHGEWGFVDEHGNIKQKDNSFFKGRAVGKIKDQNIDASFEFFALRFDELVKRFEKLREEFNASENKADFLVKIRLMLEYVYKSDSIGDFDALINRIKALEKEVFNYMQENLKKKQLICAQVEVLSSSGDLRKKTEEIRKLQGEWNNIGAVPKDQAEIVWKSFHTAVDKFYTELRKSFEEKEKQNLEKKQKLCMQAEALSSSRDWRKTNEEFKKLQKEWIATGPVPKADSEAIWERFHKAVDKFYSEMKKTFEEKEKQNLEKKQQLCLKAEELSSSKDWNKTNEEIKGLQRQWNAIGPVPKEQNEELWNRFHNAIEKFYGEMKKIFGEKEKQNLEKKQQLCLKAEELSSSRDWSKTNKEIKILQRQWNAIGPVPKEQTEEVWNRFNNAIDKFYGEMRKIFGEKEKQNLEKKQQLCLKAEELSMSKDWRKTSEELKKLQREWSKIGNVPKEESEAVWGRFRNAIDKFYGEMRRNFEEKDEERKENLEKKKLLCIQAETLIYSTNWKNASEEIKQLQQQWKNIGPVPSEESDEIWERFINALNKFYELRRAFFNNRNTELENNLNAKKKLCEAVENIISSGDVKDAAWKVKDLQSQWKSIGYVPKEYSETLWNRFREACNKVFDTSSAEYDRTQEEWRRRLFDTLQRKREQLHTIKESIDHDEKNISRWNGMLQDISPEANKSETRESIENKIFDVGSRLQSKRDRMSELESAIKEIESKI